MTLENQQVGTNQYSIDISRADNETIYSISCSGENRKTNLRIKDLTSKEYKLNEEKIATSN